MLQGTKPSALPTIRYGVTANIIAFHAIARGSIPRTGMALTLAFFVDFNLQASEVGLLLLTLTGQ